MLHCFSRDFGIEFVVVLGCFRRNLMFARSPCETLFFDESIIGLHDFTFGRNMMVTYLLDLFGYQL